ncbi:MAG TPA: flagellar hook capping protein [Rhodospirillaceae bacterium]|nr:MAG: hypothetical protein A2018_06145 [Alphaproteobacteria bacterium GWF2_58_20]HAU29093.1 flagellar hook capping protein [Rhodospirillaceae bacterium]
MTTVSSTTQTNTSTTTSSGSRLNQTFDNFLLMLTTQLQNQDPLNPMDSADFTNQLVLFSGVEQQISTNSKLDDLITSQQGSQAQAALNYIGLSAEVAGDTAPFSGSPIDFIYELPSDAQKTSISILDEAGNVIWSGNGNTSAGKHVLSWDGTRNDGSTAPTGIYQVAVGAIDALNESLETSTYVSRLITGIETSNNTVSLLSGGDVISLSDVGAVTYPAYSTNSTEE